MSTAHTQLIPFWGSGLQRQRKALADAGAEIGFVQVNGVHIRVARTPGEGVPLLFCNGIGANLELALVFARALRHPCILFDLPGLGASPAAWFWPSAKRYAGFAAGVLDELGIAEPVAVAGVSWGGLVAQRFARDYPARVSHLVLMATTPGIVMVPGRPMALARMATPQRYFSKEFMVRHAGSLYGGAMREHPEYVRQFAGLTRAPAAGAYLQQVLAMLSFSSLPWLSRLRCPALVIAGEDDPLVRPVNGWLLSKLLPHARFEKIEQGGHLFMSTHAGTVGAMVSDFLDATDRYPEAAPSDRKTPFTARKA